MFLHHVCIQTNHYSESLNFYTEVLGFKIYKESLGFHGRAFNTWLQLNSFYIELQTGKNGEVLEKDFSSKEGVVHICFKVKELEEVYENIRLKYNNFKSKNGKDIYEVEGGKLFKLIAPEGTIIEFRNSDI